eukprot:UN32004
MWSFLNLLRHVFEAYDYHKNLPIFYPTLAMLSNDFLVFVSCDHVRRLCLDRHLLLDLHLFDCALHVQIHVRNHVDSFALLTFPVVFLLVYWFVYLPLASFLALVLFLYFLYDLYLSCFCEIQNLYSDWTFVGLDHDLCLDLVHFWH